MKRNLAMLGAEGSASRRAWLGIGVVLLAFSRVYLHFSYGLSSPFMVWLAAPALVLGAALPWLLARLAARGGAVDETERRGAGLLGAETDGPAYLSHMAYQAFVATLSAWFLVAGVLQIADAPSGLTWLFPALAVGCLVTSAAGATIGA